MDELEYNVKEILSNLSGFSLSEIEDRATLVNDLQLDSLDLVKLGQELEEILGITINDSSIRANMTVAELVEEMRRLTCPSA